MKILPKKIQKEGYINLVVLAVFILLFLIPVFQNSFITFLLTRTFFYCLMAYGFGWIMGWGGMTLMCTAALYGIGGFSLIVLNVKVGLSYWQAFLLSLVIIVVFSLIYTLTLVYSKGITFMMITFIASQSVNLIAKQWIEVTGGTNGLNGLELGSIFGLQLQNRTVRYFFFLIIMFLGYLFFKRMTCSPLGLSLQGVKDEEKKLESMGFNKYLIKYVSIVIALVACGIGGMLGVSYYTHFSAELVSMNTAIMILFICILGGSSKIEGAILGSVLYIVIQDYLSSYTERYNLIIGILLIVIVLVMPQGILGIRFKKHGKDTNSRATAQRS